MIRETLCSQSKDWFMQRHSPAGSWICRLQRQGTPCAETMWQDWEQRTHQGGHVFLVCKGKRRKKKNSFFLFFFFFFYLRRKKEIVWCMKKCSVLQGHLLTLRGWKQTLLPKLRPIVAFRSGVAVKVSTLRCRSYLEEKYSHTLCWSSRSSARTDREWSTKHTGYNASPSEKLCRAQSPAPLAVPAAPKLCRRGWYFPSPSLGWLLVIRYPDMLHSATCLRRWMVVLGPIYLIIIGVKFFVLSFPFFLFDHLFTLWKPNGLWNIKLTSFARRILAARCSIFSLMHLQMITQICLLWLTYFKIMFVCFFFK